MKKDDNFAMLCTQTSDANIISEADLYNETTQF